MSSKFVALAAVALIGVGSVASARADVLFGNAGQTINGNDPILSGADGGAGPIGASFSVGAQGLNLSSLSVVLNATTPGDGQAIEASLWTDSVNGSGFHEPGSQISPTWTIADSSLTSAFSLVSVNISSGIVLASNQRYWVELASTSSSANWASTTSAGGVGVAGEYTWNNYFGAGSTMSNSSGGAPYLMEVTAVPEPAPLGLLLFGLAGLAVVRRGRRAAG